MNQNLNIMIQLENISKVFRTTEVETRALNNISFSEAKGGFTAIMGPSGCGKSTLLNIVGLLDNPSEGSYLFNGQEIGDMKEQHRTKLRKGNVGFIFQSFNLIDELTVFENVEMPLLYLGMSKKDRKEKVEAVLERIQIAHRRKHYPQQLSGGQQQRVAIARAVVADPLLLLADEPTGNLDSKNGDEVMNLLDDMNRAGTSIVMVTHSERDAKYAKRIVKLFDGQIISESANA